ncbi:hypothetical protein B0T16DRAFT_458020 [Cercophora newfieldiana]|uniref:Uncharacterized protein n=1 Tax=Cercophora newfieldiana TaxID=92897 RepID=A0AA39Y5F4_9PEZI|nr:hypothetical protein B0T16DRAFT_458020 [Cercophora newfieldiana]
MNRAPLQRALAGPAGLRASLLQSPRQGQLVLARCRAVSSVVHKVARPSFWQSVVPKFLRPAPIDDDPFFTQSRKPKRSKEWNPATFFIVIFLLVGSMSIQMIALKKEFATFIRRSDVRIGLLRDVVEKLQKGEEVDVEAALGTGVPEKEAEWDEVLKELEREEAIRKKKKSQQAQQQPQKTEATSTSKTAPTPEEAEETEEQATSTKDTFY